MPAESHPAWLDPSASFADLQSAAILLSKDSRLAEFFAVLERLARAPNTVFNSEAGTNAGILKYTALDPSGRRYMDVAQLRSAPKQDLIRDWISWRLVESVRTARKIGDAASLRPLLAPANPLLLCTALARALVADKYPAFLSRYREGLPIPPTSLFPALLGRPQYETDELLLEHLKIEEELLEALCVLSLRWIAVQRYGVVVPSGLAEPAQWRDEWLGITAAADRDNNWSAKRDREIIRWGTWLLANPVLFWFDPRSAEIILWSEGFASNTAIHNARREADRTAAAYAEQFNELLRDDLEAKVKKSRLKEAQRRRVLERRMVARANRFYLWNPSEIDARLTGNAAAAAVLKEYDRRNPGESEGK